MKSIKPGRGPSMMGAVGAIAAALFGVFWCVAALGMGAYIMLPFGLIFIGIAIANAIYSYHNATSPNRYSSFDITDSSEESDPLNDRFGRKSDSGGEKSASSSGKGRFCPYCGRENGADFTYCNFCGRKLP